MNDILSRPFGNVDLPSLTDGEYEKLTAYIRQHFGIYMKEGKKPLLAGRLQSLLVSKGFRSFTEYYNYLLADKTGGAAADLVNRITTNHTFFMREAEHFHFLKGQVLPRLARSVASRDLRIWCAACSTGEEAYTLAMLLDEFFRAEKGLWDCGVLATDISERVLSDAIRGVYDADRIEPLPAYWKLNYFKRCEKNTYCVSDAVKKEVVFRKFNLMDDVYPFKRRFHAVFCRNVMIYFDEDTKYAIAEKIYDCMEPGGYLFIGHSETLGRERTRFKYVMPAVYIKE